MNERILNIAKSKVRKHNGREYCGYMTPVEFLTLVEAGVIPVNDSTDLWYSQICKEKGECNPGWYYFYLGDLTLIQRNHHDANHLERTSRRPE